MADQDEPVPPTDTFGHSSEDAENLKITTKAPRSRNDTTFDLSTKTWQEDLTLTVEGKRLYVGSYVLSKSSPVFTSMFEREFKDDKPRELELKDKKFDDVVEFLRCLYPGIMKEVTLENVLVVLPLAHEYQVHQLKTKCESFLVNTTDESTSPDCVRIYLDQSSSCDLPKLRKKCLAVAVTTYPKELLRADLKFPFTEAIEMLKEKTEMLEACIVEVNKKCSGHEEMIKSLWIKEDEDLLEFEEASVGCLNYTVRNISKFTSVRSSSVSFHEIRWSILAKVTGEEHSRMFGFFLAVNTPEQWNEWSCKVTAKFKVCNIKKNVLSMNRSYINTFTVSDACWGYREYMAMDRLLNKEEGFADDNKVYLEIYFLANKPEINTK